MNTDKALVDLSLEDAEYVAHVFPSGQTSVIKVEFEFKDFKTWKEYEKIIKDKVIIDKLEEALKALCNKLELLSLWDKTDSAYYVATTLLKSLEQK